MLFRSAAPKSRWFSRLMGGASAPAQAVKGIYLWGGVGRGKSMLMDLVMEAAPIPQKRRVHFHEFMQHIQGALEGVRKTGQADAVRPVALAVAQQTRLLCFDEMQITDIADAMIVGRLFQVLFEEGVTIVTTSNRAPEDLYKNGLNRQLFRFYSDERTALVLCFTKSFFPDDSQPVIVTIFADSVLQAPCPHALTALLSLLNQPSPLDDSCGSLCFRYCHVLLSIVFQVCLIFWIPVFQVLWISIACLEEVVRTRDY